MISNKTSITSIGQSKYILLPYEVYNDSAFPFKEEDTLILSIEDNKVIVKKEDNR